MSLSVFFQVAAVTVITFASTNTDNLIIYTSFLTAREGSRLSLLLSYYVSMLILLCIILGLSLTLAHIPPEYIKYIGVLLSIVGIYLLIKSFFSKEGYESKKQFASGSAELVLGAAMLMDSMDTLSVFVPLFADSNERSDEVIAGVFIVCFLLLGISGLYISRLRVFKVVANHSQRVLPIIMILVGIYIYVNTEEDVEVTGKEKNKIVLLNPSPGKAGLF